jgi:hypothetical protein
MLIKDRQILKDILMNYTAQEVMRELSEISSDVADELSDNGFKDQAKDMVKFSVALNDLISGRPFLI